MTSIGTTPNPYAQYGSAYARAAATPSLAATLSGDGTAGDLSACSMANAATNLTLSDAARAQLAKAPLPDFATVTSDARITLDRLYTIAGVKAPIVDGKTTIDLSTLDRRSLFAISTNNGGKFTPDEQTVAATELKQRFDKALEPSLATTRLTGDYSISYKTALDYLDGASDEEKATATWASQRAAVLKGYQATQQDPNTHHREFPAIRSRPRWRGRRLPQRAPRATSAALPATCAPSSIGRRARRRKAARSWSTIPAARPDSSPTFPRSTTARSRRSR
ncbi:hypothetical protein J2R80_003649 [Bradyrhizobium sp. USDA 4541]|nr:hypothetical protein [Bradyrhizobium sp. USDA 4541]